VWRLRLAALHGFDSKGNVAGGTACLGGAMADARILRPMLLPPMWFAVMTAIGAAACWLRLLIL
jgi:hypothetical protein